MKITNTQAEAKYPWPEGTYLQGRDPYGPHRAFVEAFPDGKYFRGEGHTVADAERWAWNRYQRYMICDKTGHEWEAKGYRNGGGICKHCGAFDMVFTLEEVGSFCVDCGTPTYWHVKDNGDLQCEKCAPPSRELYPYLFEDEDEDEVLQFSEKDLEDVLMGFAGLADKEKG